MNLRRTLTILGFSGLLFSSGAATALPPGVSPEQVQRYLNENPDAKRELTARTPARPPVRSNSVRNDSVPTWNLEDSLQDRDSLGRAKHLGDSLLQRPSQRAFLEANPALFGAQSGALGPQYALGPGDELILTLWGDREARYVQAIDRDGLASFEGIGAVSFNGKTLGQAQELLKGRMARIYSGMGQTQFMDLTLGKLKKVRVFVVGEVVAPGGYILSGNTNVLSALYMAHGPSEIGSERKIFVRRGNREHTIDLYDYLFRGVRPVNDLLQDGDVVRVPSHGALVAIKGAVKKPGLYEMLGSESASDLVNYAGGLAPGGSAHGLRVSRLFENGRRDAVFYPDFTNKSAKRDPFRDGDTAWVSFGREQSRSTVHASGNVRFPGSYPWISGNTAADLLQTAGGLDDSAYEARIIVLRRDTLGQLWSLRSSAANATSISLIPGDSLRVFNRLLMSDSDSVRISGAVREPGRFPYRRGMTLKDLILLAGGFLPDAEFGKVRLEQSSKDSLGATTRYLALDSSLKADAADQLLEPNQHLAIPYNPRWHKPEEVMIQGWVVRPGLYLLKHPGERLSSVIERAGGLKDGGYAHAAIFTRGRDSVGRVRINLPQALSKPGSKFDIAMRGDDTLRIPDRPATVRVSGWVNYPTAVMYEKGRSWKWYVAQAGGFSDSANTKGVWVRYADGSILSRDYGLDDPDAGAEIVVPKAPPKRELTATEQVQIWSGIVGIAMTVATLVVLVTKN